MADAVKVIVSGARGAASTVPGPAGTVTDASGFLGALAIVPDGRKPKTVRSTDAKSLEQVDLRDAYSGTGTATSGAPRNFSGDNAPSGDDSFHLIGRNVVGDRLFSHAVRDESTFISTNDSAYCSFDSAPRMSGATAYNHLRSYQGRPDFAGAGSLGELNSFGHQPKVSSGTVQNLYGLHVFNAQKGSGATINTQVGVWVDQLSGAANNFAIYATGNDSALLGRLTIAGAFDGATQVNASGQVTGTSVQATGTIAEYKASGGVLTAGAVGGAGYGAVMAYSDSSGASRGLSINSNGGVVVVGQATPTSGAGLQVKGGVSPIADNVDGLGSASLRFATIYAGSPTINTSDERLKHEIGGIPDEWLDAWGAVQWCRYKFTGGSRWHIGLVAQMVHKAFADAGLDAFEIGLCCYDQWDERREPTFEMVERTREVEKDVPVATEVLVPRRERVSKRWRTVMVKVPKTEIVKQMVPELYEASEPTGKEIVTLEAGDRWGLRYDECFAIEAAYQRRETARERARRDQFEERLRLIESRPAA